MSGVFKAEVRKITTTRLWWLIGICVAVLSVAASALPALVALTGPQTDGVNPLADPGLVRSIYHGGNLPSRVLAMLLAIVVVGGEYRYRTLTATYLAAPDRIRLAGGRAVALLLFGLCYGVVSVGAGLGVASYFVHAHGGSLFLRLPDTWRSLALGACSIAIWTLIGLGVGSVIKNLLVAVLVGVGVGFVIESVLSVVFYVLHLDLLLNLMPTGATNSALGVTARVMLASPRPEQWWLGCLLLAVWCLLPAFIGVLYTSRRDVN